MNYTEMLKQEYLDRKNRRSAYSERAFARDLKVSPGYISLLFRGHRELSPAKGIQIAQRLGWAEDKTRQFVDSIQQRSLATSTLAAATRGRPETGSLRFAELELDKFRLIADLNHFAVMTLIKSRPNLDSRRIAAILGIGAVEAELIVSRLSRVGVVRIDDKGRLKSTKNPIEIKATPSEAIRSFHRQALRRAEVAIDEQPSEHRNLAALTLSFDRKHLGEARAFLDRFLKAFDKKFGHAPSGEIYQLNTQLFALSKEGE